MLKTNKKTTKQKKDEGPQALTAAEAAVDPRATTNTNDSTELKDAVTTAGKISSLTPPQSAQPTIPRFNNTDKAGKDQPLPPTNAKSIVTSLVSSGTTEVSKETIEMVNGLTAEQIKKITQVLATVRGSEVTATARDNNSILTDSKSATPLTLSASQKESDDQQKELVEKLGTVTAVTSLIPELPSQYTDDNESYSSYTLKGQFNAESAMQLSDCKFAPPDFEPIFVPAVIGDVNVPLPEGAPATIFSKTWELLGPGSITVYWTLSQSFLKVLARYGVKWERNTFILDESINSLLHTSGTTAADMSTTSQSALLARIFASIAMVEYASVVVTDKSVTISTFAKNIGEYGPLAESLQGREVITPVGFVATLIEPLITDTASKDMANMMMSELPVPHIGRIDTIYAPGTQIIQERRFFHTLDTLTSALLVMERARLIPSTNPGDQILHLLQACANGPFSIQFGNRLAELINLHADIDFTKLKTELLYALVCFPSLKEVLRNSWRDAWLSLGVMTPWVGTSDLDLALSAARPQSVESRYATAFKTMTTAKSTDYIDTKIEDFGPDLRTYQYPVVLITKDFAQDRGALTAMFLTWHSSPRECMFGKPELGNFIWNFMRWYDQDGSLNITQEFEVAARAAGTFAVEGRMTREMLFNGKQSCFFTYKFQGKLAQFQEVWRPTVMRIPQDDRDAFFPRLYSTDHVFVGSSARIHDDVNEHTQKFARFNKWLNSIDPLTKADSKRPGAAVLASTQFIAGIEAAVTPIRKREVFWSHINSAMCHSWQNLGNGYTGALDSLPSYTIGLSATEGHFKSTMGMMQMDGSPVQRSWGTGAAGANVFCYHLGALNSIREMPSFPSTLFAFPSPEAFAHMYLNFISLWKKEVKGLGYAQLIYRLMSGKIKLPSILDQTLSEAKERWKYVSKQTGMKKVLRMTRGVSGGSDTTFSKVMVDDRAFETPDSMIAGKLVVVTRTDSALVLRPDVNIPAPSPVGLDQEITLISPLQESKFLSAFIHLFHPNGVLSHIVRGVLFSRVDLSVGMSKVSVFPGGKRKFVDGKIVNERPLIAAQDHNFVIQVINGYMVNCFKYDGKVYSVPSSFPELDIQITLAQLRNKTIMNTLELGLKEGKFGIYVPDAVLEVRVTHSLYRTNVNELNTAQRLLREISASSIPIYDCPRMVSIEGQIFAHPPVSGSCSYYVHLLDGNSFNEAIMDSPFRTNFSTDTTYFPDPMIQTGGELEPSGLASVEIDGRMRLKVDLPGAMSNINPMPVLSYDNIVTLAEIDFTVQSNVAGNPLDQDFFLFPN